MSSMFDNPQKSIDIATEMAYGSMVAALINKEGNSKIKRSILSGERFLEGYSNGDYEWLIAPKKQIIRINFIHINVDFTGTVNLKFVNELGQEVLVEVTGVVAGVTKTVVIDEAYNDVKISINENISGRDTYNGVSGLLIDYTIDCDYDSFICNNKTRFQTAMDYKVASILLTDGQFSGELDKRKMIDSSYAELKAEYETQYAMELKNLSLMDSGCFDCASRIRIKSWI